MRNWPDRARVSHKKSINLRLRHSSFRIRRFDASIVQNADVARRSLPDLSFRLIAKEPVRLAYNRRRGCVRSNQSPNRFVGDGDLSKLAGRKHAHAAR